MSTAVDRVSKILKEHHVDAEVITLKESAHTADQAAQALNCDVAQIVKSLIFKTQGTGLPVLALVSGDKRLDSSKLVSLVNQELIKADAEFVKQMTGFSIGGVAPVGSLNRLPAYMDQTLLDHEYVWAAAGHPKSIFKIASDHLVQIASAEVADLAE